jgi:hypothetical protein
MIQIKTQSSKETSPEHYAVGVDTLNKKVLIQLGDDHGEQIRVALTREEALYLAKDLLKKSQKIKD